MGKRFHVLAEKYYFLAMLEHNLMEKHPPSFLRPIIQSLWELNSPNIYYTHTLQGAGISR